uniref:histone H1B-like n=1 Tax=Pristiophorus japonicus TaxID=55135 RepID=UPI00398E9EA1
MTDTAAADTALPAAAAQTKARSKKSVVYPCSKPAVPKLDEQILKVVADGSDRKGMSLAAIMKALAAKVVDVEMRGSLIRFIIKRNVTNGSLKQIKGTGASGSFKVAEKQTPGKQTSSKKSPIAKQTAKAPAGKEAAAKKPKSPKKATGAKVKAAKKVEKPRAKATPKSA